MKTYIIFAGEVIYFQNGNIVWRDNNIPDCINKILK